MKNVFLLPTDKPSRLQLQINGKLHLENGQSIALKSFQNLYITSEEDIEEGDWFIFYSKQLGWPPKVYKHIGLDIYNFIKVYEDMSVDPVDCNRIALATDPELINDEVQEIDNELLQWIIENPSCEEVEVFYGLFSPMGRQVDPSDLTQNQSSCTWKYKVELAQGYICPQTKKQCDDECCVSAEDCHLEASIGVISDCEPEDGYSLQSKRRIYSRREMIEFGKKCAEFGYENELDNEGQLTDEWINENL